MLTKQCHLRFEDYTVGWVCALPIELARRTEMPDQEDKDLSHDDSSDPNLYTLGRIRTITLSLPAPQLARWEPTLLSRSSDEAEIPFNSCALLGCWFVSTKNTENLRLQGTKYAMPS